MQNFINKNEHYDEFFKIVETIETRRNNAYKKVNEELVGLYWDIGRFISEQINNKKWGDKVVQNQETFIKQKYPTLKGFNCRGLYRMKQFYEL